MFGVAISEILIKTEDACDVLNISSRLIHTLRKVTSRAFRVLNIPTVPGEISLLPKKPFGEKTQIHLWCYLAN